MEISNEMSCNPTEAWAQMKINATVMRFKTRSNPKDPVAKVYSSHSIFSKVKSYVLTERTK